MPIVSGHAFRAYIGALLNGHEKIARFQAISPDTPAIKKRKNAKATQEIANKKRVLRASRIAEIDFA